MLLRHAAEMLAPSGLAALGPTTWADFGCGDGTFTLALAEALAAGSVIYAIDRNASALRAIPAQHRGVHIHTRRADFTKRPWPIDDVDGILMANSLHYVDDPAAFIGQCELLMKRRRHFVIVEYDLHEPNRWIPYPVGRAALVKLFETAGYSSITMLGSRPSVYHRARIYAALIEP